MAQVRCFVGILLLFQMSQKLIHSNLAEGNLRQSDLYKFAWYVCECGEWSLRIYEETCAFTL